MKRAIQVVFLIDLEDEALWKGTHQEGISLIGKEVLRKTCLRLLTYFAAQQCVSNGVDSSTGSILVKWGYKFYLSCSKKTVYQRYHFHDLEFVSLEKFETELETHLNKVAAERLLCADSCRQYSRTSSHSSILLSSGAKPLAQAVRELVCDFPWDSPYISSPVKRPRYNSPSSLNHFKNDDNESSLVDNYAILITTLPNTTEQLNSFLGSTSTHRPNFKDIVEHIISENVKQRLCNVAKIRLLWLDTFPFYNTIYCQELELKERRHILEVVHQALSVLGGGILPIGAVLLRDTLRDGFGPQGASCHRFSFPESYRIRVPFASLISLYLSYCDIPESDLHHYETVLKFPQTGLFGNTTCTIDLLPLFKRKSWQEVVICDNALSSQLTPSKYFSKCSMNTNFNFNLIKPLGKLKLSDMRNRLLVDYEVILCCPKTITEFDKDVFQKLLDDLIMDYSALVVSCGSSRLGLLVPASDDACVAVLYLLLAKAVSSTNFAVSEGDEITKLVHQLKVPLNFHVDVESSTKVLRKSKELHGIKHLQLNKSLVSKTRKMNKGEDELIKKLERCNQTTVPTAQNLNFRADELKRNSTLLGVDKPAFNNEKICEEQFVDLKSEYDVSAEVTTTSSCDVLEQSQTKVDIEVEENVILADLTTESLLLADIKNTYNKALSDGGYLLSTAQNIIAAVRRFYCASSAENAEQNIKVRNFITKNIILDAEDVSTKYKVQESQKTEYIQECCLQVVIRLELLLLLKSLMSELDYTSIIIDFLRKLSFVAGPSTLSSFLKNTIHENYYASLKDIVVEICEELNQPLPNEGSELLSPTLSCSSTLSLSNIGHDLNSFAQPHGSELSTSSSVSSCGNQSISKKPKRNGIVRHPSFSDVSRKRQIIVPAILARRNSMVITEKGSLQRHLKQPKSGGSFEKISDARRIRRNLFECDKPTTVKLRNHTVSKHFSSPKHLTTTTTTTTPKGRHVLKTTTVAETPLHKQVSHVALARQSQKRKLASIDDDVMLVKESPDKVWDEFPFRRSPRVHASSLERQASFYSSKTLSRNLAKAESQLKADTLEEAGSGKCSAPVLDASDCSLRLKNNTVNDREEMSPVLSAKSRNKARVRHSLYLASPAIGDLPASDQQTPIKKRNLQCLPNCAVVTTRSRRPNLCAELFDSSDAVAEQPCSSQMELQTLVDVVNHNAITVDVNASEDDEVARNVALVHGEIVPEKSESSVFIKLDDEVPNSEETCDNAPNASTVDDDVQNDEIMMVLSTPLRNGIESPTECQLTECLPFPRGPLTDADGRRLSRSSSPRFPLLCIEPGMHFDNVCDSFCVGYDDEMYSTLSDIGNISSMVSEESKMDHKDDSIMEDEDSMKMVQRPDDVNRCLVDNVAVIVQDMINLVCDSDVR